MEKEEKEKRCVDCEYFTDEDAYGEGFCERRGTFEDCGNEACKESFTPKNNTENENNRNIRTNYF